MCINQNARRGAHQGAQRQLTRRHACSTVTSAVQSVCVFLLEHTGTSRCAPAITTGRPREEAPNALRICHKLIRPTSILFLNSLVLSICLFLSGQLSNPDDAWELVGL